MKRLSSTLCLLLALALALSVTACGNGNTASSTGASSQAASATADASSKEELPLKDENGYVIVRNMLDHLGLSFGGNADACFPEDAAGYFIEGGPYRVSPETLRRLTTVPCKGDGTVQWEGFKELNSLKNPDPFTGVVPATKLNDPVYMSMNLPSEAPTFMTNRINPENMAPYPAEANRALPIGAIYRNLDTPIADDEHFTICLGRMCLALKTVDKDWHIGDALTFPSKPNKLYFLPWEKTGNATLPDDRLKEQGDHIEVSLTGADLNGVAARDKGAVGAVLHFWGSFVTVNSGSNVKGMASSYVVWVKEPKMLGKLAACVGIDWYAPNGGIKQAYSGYNYLLTNEPRIVFGHTVGPKAYDSIMDTDKVQQFIGLK